jgi:hypothetical protein
VAETVQRLAAYGLMELQQNACNGIIFLGQEARLLQY